MIKLSQKPVTGITFNEYYHYAYELTLKKRKKIFSSSILKCLKPPVLPDKHEMQ